MDYRMMHVMWDPEEIRNKEDRDFEYAPEVTAPAVPKPKTLPPQPVDPKSSRPKTECSLRKFDPCEWDPSYRDPRKGIQAWVPYSSEEKARGLPHNGSEMDNGRLVYEAYRTRIVRLHINDDELEIVKKFTVENRQEMAEKYWELSLHYMEEIDFRIKSGNAGLADTAERAHIHPKQWEKYWS